MNFNTTETLIKLTLFAALFALLTACGGEGSGGVGYQEDNLPPVANATAIGLGKSQSTTTKSFTARGKSEILITGKDSFSEYAPIQDYSWEQTGTGPSVEFIERTNTTVLFNAPNVGVETDLNFRLTITDANGNTDTDELTITIIAVDDAERFLTDPSNPDKQLSIVAALRGGESTGDSSQPFTLEVITSAHWLNRLGEMDQLVLKTETISDAFDSNFSPESDYDPLSESANPTVVIKLHPLDLDDINKNFETIDRDRRLEAYEASSAYLDIQIKVVEKSSVDFELIALTVTGDDSIDIANISALANETSLGANAALASLLTKPTVRTKINGKTLSNSTKTSVATNGALLQTWNGELTATLLTTNVLAALGIENSISANNYYALIDPQGQFSTLSNWLEYAGFEDAYGDPVNDAGISHALYLNNFDLGFARDMRLRKDVNGNVYSYVTNYPTLEAALEARGEFAVVAMEYSENPDPDGENAKIVKFYAFVPDERNGDFIRSASMNFDGAGEKFIPGVCAACHQSNPGNRQFTDVSEADINATFIPWDLDSFLYAHASDPKFVEPTLDASKFSAEVLDANSLEAQGEQLRQLNLGTLATYVDNPERHAASIQLIHGWYGDEDLALPVDQLPISSFNGEYTQPGWVEQEDLYHDVYARNCRICHTQVDNEDTNFDSYDEFISRPKLISKVFELGKMPLARLSFDRFWVPYDGGDSSASILRSHLQSLGNFVPKAPGAPVPRFTFNTITPTIDDQVIMDASTSSYAESYSWSLLAPQGSAATLNKLIGVSSTFDPDIAGGDFEVSLTITNKSGVQETVSQNISIIDRAPIATCFSTDSADLSNNGLLAGIPVTSLIGVDEDGDGAVTINSMIDGTLGSASIDAGNLDFSYQLFNPFNRGEDRIAYQLVDIDGSLSTTSIDCLNSPPAGFGYVSIDTSSAGLVPTNVVAAVDSVNNTFEVDISWDPPTEVTADSYTLWRDDVEISLNEEQQNSRSFTDSPLLYDTIYTYTARTVINGFQSDDSFPAQVTTASLVPDALVGTSVSPTQINLVWEAPLGNATSYSIYRDDGTGSILLQANILEEAYSDNSVSGNTLFEYVVTGLDDSGQESVPSNIASNAPKPEPPTSLTAESVSTSQINLSWPAVDDADSYKIYRKLSSEPGFPVTPLATPGTNSYSDTTVSAGFSYDYQVGVTIGFEDSIEFAADSETAFPAAPVLQSAAVNGTSTSRIDLSWASPGGNITSYIVYRGATALATGSTSTSYNDTGIAAGTQYNYTVTAVAGGHESAPSVVRTAATYPSAPTGLSVTSKNTSQIAVGWNASSGQVDSYKVYVNNAGRPSTASTSDTVTSLTSYTSYLLKVDATSNGLTSTLSTTINVTTDVSYAVDIVGTVVANHGCNSCHVDNSFAAIKFKFTNNPSSCITNNLDINDCSPGDMVGITLTQQELDLILLWKNDGSED
jgi:fibronectin type 3 domain-containing protein